jgi:hypothetical protein
MKPPLRISGVFVYSVGAAIPLGVASARRGEIIRVVNARDVDETASAEAFRYKRSVVHQLVASRHTEAAESAGVLGRDPLGLGFGFLGH